MRILVTNDDGVHAPGLAALARALWCWIAEPSGEEHELVVVAPLSNHSGAGAAVGPVFERETVRYRVTTIEGAADIPAYGVDASPALAVIVAAAGAFGPPPDLVVSGINLGVNVGRSLLHSGTVGAVLSGAQLGMSGLAVSMRSRPSTHHWDTAAATAIALIPSLTAAPAPTIFNLNVPSVPIRELRGIRRGRISRASIVGSATTSSLSRSPAPPRQPSPNATPTGDPGDEGEVELHMGAAVPSLGDVRDEAPEDDGALVAAGFASLTPLVNLHEAEDDRMGDVVRAALASARRRLDEMGSTS